MIVVKSIEKFALDHQQSVHNDVRGDLLLRADDRLVGQQRLRPLPRGGNGNAYIFGFPDANGYLVVVDLSSLTWTENIPITDSYPVGGVFLEAPSGPPLGSWSKASQSNWSGQGPVV